MTAPALQIAAFARAAEVLCAHGDADVQAVGLTMSAWLAGTGPKALETVATYKKRDALVYETTRRFRPHEKPKMQPDELAKAILRYHPTGILGHRRPAVARRIQGE